MRGTTKKGVGYITAACLLGLIARPAQASQHRQHYAHAALQSRVHTAFRPLTREARLIERQINRNYEDAVARSSAMDTISGLNGI